MVRFAQSRDRHRYATRPTATAIGSTDVGADLLRKRMRQALRPAPLQGALRRPTTPHLATAGTTPGPPAAVKRLRRGSDYDQQLPTELKRQEPAIEAELERRKGPLSATEGQALAARGYIGRTQEPDHGDDRSKWSTSEHQAFAARGIKPKRRVAVKPDRDELD